MQHLTAQQWDQLDDLLVMLADQPLPTWKQKRDHAKAHLSESAINALIELSTWEWEE